MKQGDLHTWLSLFLDTVRDMLVEEAEHLCSLFGGDRAPVVLCSLLQHSVQPLCLPLVEKLLLLDSPVLIIAVYDLIELFTRGVVGGGYLVGCGSQLILNALTMVYTGKNEIIKSDKNLYVEFVEGLSVYDMI